MKQCEDDYVIEVIKYRTERFVFEYIVFFLEHSATVET